MQNLSSINAEFEYEVSQYDDPIFTQGVLSSPESHGKGTIIWKSDGKKFSCEYKPDFVQWNNKIIPADQVSYTFHTRETYNGKFYIKEIPEKKMFHIMDHFMPATVGLLTIPDYLLTDCGGLDWLNQIQSPGAAPRFLGWEQFNGSKCGVLEFNFVDLRGGKEVVDPDETFKVWIDMEHGLMPVQFIICFRSEKNPNAFGGTAFKITELKQINSIWTPKKIEYTVNYDVRTPRFAHSLTVKSMEVGVSRSPDEFNVKFPAGAWVDDTVHGTWFTVKHPGGVWVDDHFNGPIGYSGPKPVSGKPH